MVVASLPNFITVESFLERYGDDDRYELIDGEIFDLEPRGPHEEVAAFIDRKLNVQIDHHALDYFVLQRGLLKPDGDLTAFRPDIMVIERPALQEEPLWDKQSVITRGLSVRLVAEVVSSNWQNDYARKMEDYAKLGISEYWIADYAALGGERFIGSPKKPTLTICTLVEGRYQDRQLRANDPIQSLTFPELKLTAQQVLRAGQ